MKKTRMLSLIAVFSALYFVLSALFKIPIAGHITLDLGYISLMVACIYLGPVPGLIVGLLGAAMESTLLSQSGISIGWILMNGIIGVLCGWLLPGFFKKDKIKFIGLAIPTILVSVFLGVCVKTFFDCIIRGYPLAVKIPTSLAAWITDSLVMLIFGIPISFLLKKIFVKL